MCEGNALVVMRKEGKKLAGGTEFVEGCLDIPGGVMVPLQDRDVRSAAVRELHEETGIVAAPEKLTELGNWNRQHFFFTYEMESPELPVVRVSHEHIAYGWMSLWELLYVASLRVPMTTEGMPTRQITAMHADIMIKALIENYRGLYLSQMQDPSQREAILALLGNGDSPIVNLELIEMQILALLGGESEWSGVDSDFVVEMSGRGQSEFSYR